MQTGSSETLTGWKSGKTTYVPLLDRMESVAMDSVRNTTLSQVRVYRIQYTHKAHEDYKYCSLVQIHLQISYYN